MNSLVQGYDFQLNCYSKSVFPEENHVSGYELDPELSQISVLANGSSSPVDESSPEGDNSKEISVPTNGFSPVYESSSSECESLKETDHSDAILKFISQMLMEEEDLENKPCMLHDCLALQATEKSLYDVLNNNLDQNFQSPNDHFTKTFSASSSDLGSFVESYSSPSGDFESLISPSEVQYPSLNTVESDLVSFETSMAPFWVSNSFYQSNSRGKKNRFRKDRDFIGEQRSSKQFANNIVESEPLEMYDKVLLCSDSDQSEAKKKPLQIEQRKASNRGRPRGGKKQGVVKEVVDLRSLLMQCAQAVASYDSRTFHDLLARIRQHSSPRGDGTERLVHYFANALEARLAGNGTASYAALTSTRRSAAEILKAYKTYITACPFKKLSNVLANRTIKKLATGATTLHIIDFGILYGYQWPCLIQILSERPGGPPKLKITGIDFPQPGFRPAERVADTGHRLAKYCKRFGVPFEYNAIAQKWETIKVEDLKIEENELVVVNSLYRLQNVPDETVTVNSPRDAVLDLIEKINPDVFIHGVVNGTYNTPFFITRFREALFHFSSMFDMFEATVPREDQERLLFEEVVYGKDVMNIIACEGTERLERPETYKQWQVRNLRAGFRPLPLDQEIVKHVRRKVKMEYHKDFSVDEDGNWMLQGWKGRVIYAISYWQSSKKQS